MYTTTIVPKTEHYPLNQEILNKAERIIIESAKLTGNLNIQVINAIKDNLLSLVHIEVQKYLESTLDISRPSYSLDKILEIHEEFYKKTRSKNDSR